MIKIEHKFADYYIPEDVFLGEEGHPQCCFFELMIDSPDPECNTFSFKFCYIDYTDNKLHHENAKICNGDYLLCPIAFGHSARKSEESDDPKSNPC